MSAVIDIRAQVYCEIGGSRVAVLSGEFSDSGIQQSGLITTTGRLTLAGLVSVEVGTRVRLGYERNGVVGVMPRSQLRVTRVLADPFADQTQVELGCLLSIAQGVSTTEALGVQQQSAAPTPLAINPALVVVQAVNAATGQAIECPSLPTIYYSVDYSSGYLNAAAAILQAFGYYLYLGDNETVRIGSVNFASGAVAAVTSDDLIEIRPLAGGDVPASQVVVSGQVPRASVAAEPGTVDGSPLEFNGSGGGSSGGGEEPQGPGLSEQPRQDDERLLESQVKIEYATAEAVNGNYFGRLARAAQIAAASGISGADLSPRFGRGGLVLKRREETTYLGYLGDGQEGQRIRVYESSFAAAGRASFAYAFLSRNGKEFTVWHPGGGSVLIEDRLEITAKGGITEWSRTTKQEAKIATSQGATSAATLGQYAREAAEEADIFASFLALGQTQVEEEQRNFTSTERRDNLSRNRGTPTDYSAGTSGKVDLFDTNGNRIGTVQSLGPGEIRGPLLSTVLGPTPTTTLPSTTALYADGGRTVQLQGVQSTTGASATTADTELIGLRVAVEFNNSAVTLASERTYQFPLVPWSNPASLFAAYGERQNRFSYGSRYGVNIKAALGAIPSEPGSVFTLNAAGQTGLFLLGTFACAFDANEVAVSCDALYIGAVGGNQ